MSEIITRINLILEPIEWLIGQYKKYIWYFLLFLALSSFWLVFFPDTVKFSGEQSMNALWFILFLPILVRVFGISIARVLMPLRKELGILMWTLAFVHGVTYIAPYPTILGDSYFWTDNTTVISYLGVGFLALLLSIPLTLTSSSWMMKKMWKYWKMLHRTVYIIIILTVIHVVLLKWYREFEFWQVLLLSVYFGFKILEWRGFSFIKKDTKKIYPKWQKWLCVPCGYIYDPVLWDEADGIAPGTEFSDIPDNWYCPLCGVTKADFVPLDDTTTQIEYQGRIIEKTLLNPVTLKLVIETIEELKSIPGQFATFVWFDNEWEFTRSYSIAEHSWKKLTFLIKLTELGRGARVLRDIAWDATIRIKGIFGRFILQDTTNPKVFIATGTGLAPIYNMIYSLGETTKKSLYFTVATGNELFYTEELRAINNLDLHIHTTKEELSGYEFGRVSIDDIVATPETEWYLCGNPRMVEEATMKLWAKWYERIYSEEFN